MRTASSPAIIVPASALALFYGGAWLTRAHWPHAVTLQWGADGVRAVSPLHALVEATLVAAALYLVFTVLAVVRPEPRRTRLFTPIRMLLPTGVLIVYAGLFFGATSGDVYRSLGLGAGLAACLVAVLTGVARAGLPPTRGRDPTKE